MNQHLALFNCRAGSVRACVGGVHVIPLSRQTTPLLPRPFMGLARAQDDHGSRRTKLLIQLMQPLEEPARTMFGDDFDSFSPHVSRRHDFANAAIASSRVASWPCAARLTVAAECPLAHIHGRPCGAVGTVKMRPTTTPFCQSGLCRSSYRPAFGSICLFEFIKWRAHARRVKCNKLIVGHGDYRNLRKGSATRGGRVERI